MSERPALRGVASGFDIPEPDDEPDLPTATPTPARRLVSEPDLIGALVVAAFVNTLAVTLIAVALIVQAIR